MISTQAHFIPSRPIAFTPLTFGQWDAPDMAPPPQGSGWPKPGSKWAELNQSMVRHALNTGPLAKTCSISSNALTNLTRTCFHELGHFLYLVGSKAAFTPIKVSILPSGKAYHPHVEFLIPKIIEEEGPNEKDMLDVLACLKGGKAMEALVYGTYTLADYGLDNQMSDAHLEDYTARVIANAPEELPKFQAMVAQHEPHARNILQRFSFKTVRQLAQLLAKELTWNAPRIQQIIQQFNLHNPVPETPELLRDELAALRQKIAQKTQRLSQGAKASSVAAS